MANSSSSQEPRRATAGSSGLDLRATSRLVLTPQMGVQLVDSSFRGPLSPGTAKGLHIAPEKVQRDEVVNNLGSRITTASVVPQKVELRKDHLHTLNDFQTLLGDIQWDQQDPVWVPECLVRRIPEDRKVEDVASMDDVESAEPAVVDDVGPAVPPNGDCP
ncbi:hypothetical protein STEG23_004563 [Scotinomys teguina]